MMVMLCGYGHGIIVNENTERIKFLINIISVNAIFFRKIKFWIIEVIAENDNRMCNAHWA